LFQNERIHQENITPHSHRFDFQCWVLRGHVVNRIWTKNFYLNHPQGDQFIESVLKYEGEFGKYEKSIDARSNWSFKDYIYQEGECYSMIHNEVHSINFSKGAIVLFFEGPTISDTSIVIEPYTDGEHIPTMQIAPWMFKKRVNTMHRRYWNDEDQKIFIRLVRSGLKEKQAVEQMEIIGIKAMNKDFTNREGLVGTEPKTNFPSYHHNRRW
jgi:hypothetical protein